MQRRIRLPIDAPATSSSLSRRLRWRVLSGPLRAGLDQSCRLRANRGLPGHGGACGSFSLRGRGRAGLRACAPSGSACCRPGSRPGGPPAKAPTRRRRRAR